MTEPGKLAGGLLPRPAGPQDQTAKKVEHDGNKLNQNGKSEVFTLQAAGHFHAGAKRG